MPDILIAPLPRLAKGRNNNKTRPFGAHRVFDFLSSLTFEGFARRCALMEQLKNKAGRSRSLYNTKTKKLVQSMIGSDLAGTRAGPSS
jgi:hypothetical protein